MRAYISNDGDIDISKKYLHLSSYMSDVKYLIFRKCTLYSFYEQLSCLFTRTIFSTFS